MRNKLSRIIILFLFVASLSGCEAFRKKFVRKPKGEKEIKVVVNTQEYVSQYSRKQIYEKYFLFWKAANDELLGLLNIQEVNRKKRIYYAEKIAENLLQMQQLLAPEKQKALDAYIAEQKQIVVELKKYSLSLGKKLQIKGILRKQRREVRKEFSYKNIEEYLIKE
ncbi:MAG: hypothetical protein JSV30_05215 [Candidatus Omnitrophota bacterium]|nr:MAG: hypothetical protein JSV30_05215 [Candidatus Omnitrophota bacterium]